MSTSGNLIISTELIDAEPDLPDALREKNPGRLRVAISDSGVGIAPENLGKVFEPFFTTKPKGTGLGLPITRRIIHEHRGTISVESQPNKGSTFSIVFPIFRKTS
jgi:signal transduction histidine kinase